MRTGPFDRRSKRSRCSPCFSSHIKCDGASPCNNCHRRGITCSYKTPDSLIRIKQSKVKTVFHFSSKQGVVQSVPTLQIRTLSPIILERYLFYFDIFAQQNSFVANTISYDCDVKTLLGTGSGDYLLDAVSALGALQSSRLRHTNSREDFQAAIKAYSSAVRGLRLAMTHSSPPSRLHVLWTTLLLGLFELMSSESGEPWLVHMVHGTGAALQAAGPSLCMSGLGQSFFLQARVFEVSRALLLGDSTFLSEPQWTLLCRGLYADGTIPGQMLNELLDIIVGCSHLRVKTSQLISSLSCDTISERRCEAQALADEGMQLREALHTWRCKSLPRWNTLFTRSTSYESNLVTLCKIFFAAISIFLSGVFDYEILYWQKWGLSVPTLPEEQVQQHVQTILDLISHGLHYTSISPLLFLFSLRIVGARSYEQRRQAEVLDVLGSIGHRFTVARVFQMELRRVWQLRG